MQTIYRRSAQRRLRISKPETTLWQRSLPSWVVTLAVGLTLLCLTIFAGCAAIPSRQVVLDSCYVPTQELRPTPVPPLNDAKGKDLVQEANDSRDAVTACNKDKADALKSLLLQNKRRQS